MLDNHNLGFDMSCNLERSSNKSVECKAILSDDHREASHHHGEGAEQGSARIFVVTILTPLLLVGFIVIRFPILVSLLCILFNSVLLISLLAVSLSVIILGFSIIPISLVFRW